MGGLGSRAEKGGCGGGSDVLELWLDFRGGVDYQWEPWVGVESVHTMNNVDGCCNGT